MSDAAIVSRQAGGGEPSESEMKEAMLYAMNHPPGVTNSDPVTISANIGASMYNNIPFAVFYRDKDRGGQWNMRPPF
jgi:hypothetical protein